LPERRKKGVFCETEFRAFRSNEAKIQRNYRAEAKKKRFLRNGISSPGYVGSYIQVFQRACVAMKRSGFPTKGSRFRENWSTGSNLPWGGLEREGMKVGKDIVFSELGSERKLGAGVTGV
jgi:hypothetical protein